MECYFYLRNIQDLVSDGKTPNEAPFGIPFNGSVIPFGVMVECDFISANILSIHHQLGLKVLPGFFLWICVVCGENLERRHNGHRH